LIFDYIERSSSFEHFIFVVYWWIDELEQLSVRMVRTVVCSGYRLKKLSESRMMSIYRKLIGKMRK